MQLLQNGRKLFDDKNKDKAKSYYKVQTKNGHFGKNVQATKRLLVKTWNSL